MCGICGTVGLQDRRLVEGMRDSMSHRGPDDKGVFTGDGISLGHRRLSVIDLSVRGRQPMHNPDESVWIVYNGETYNYRELRGGLEKKGYNFNTDTDTEVILHAYEEYGLDFLSRLRGQCALAIWDSSRRRLVMARDRIGIKPLYYTLRDGILFFASEMKALFKYEEFRPEMNYPALDNYLAFQYVPEPETIFKDVFKVLPGEVIVYENGRLGKKTYWDLDINPEGPALSEEQYVEQVRSLLSESVRLRLVSDVPLGVHLSGGIDSSSIAAVMSELVSEPIKTFSIGYGHEEVDELEYARIVAEHLGTDHQEIIVGPDKVVRELGDIVWHLDEPVGDPAIMPQYFLAKHTKKKVTVVFNGGGSDEVFAGYRAYKYLLLAEKIRGLAPAFIREGGASILAKASLPSNIKRYVEYVGSPGNEKTYWGQGLLFNGDERNSLYSGSLKEKVGGNNPAESIRKHLHAKKKSRYTLNRFLYVDIKGWLTDNCTMLLDKVMMAHAVECRVPFLDHKLVEYAMTIPPGLKTRGMKKYVLRKAFEGRLPKQIIERPKKGFGVPTDCWFFKDVNDMITERLTSSEFIKENFNTGRIDFLLKKTRDFRHSHQLFGLLTLDLWNERYLRAVG